MTINPKSSNHIEVNSISKAGNQSHFENDCEAPDFEADEFKYFEGFPYLVTRLFPAGYHIILLSESSNQKTLCECAERQIQFNRIDTCLVLAARSCIYFSPDGRIWESDEIPAGGTVLSGYLRPFYKAATSPEMIKRLELLEDFKINNNKGNTFFGDITKGGHLANELELIGLKGHQPNGIPIGLELCGKCHEWRGECLDSSPQFMDMVMKVHCLCENDNRCAGCGDLLSRRKLNSNYFSVDDHQIWHHPGFMAIEHICK